MKISFGTVWVYLLATLTTLGFIFFNLTFQVTVMENGKPVELMEPPDYIHIFWHNDYGIIWILLAGLSLIGNMAWGYKRSKSGEVDDPHTLPLISHLSYILAVFLMNLFALRFWQFLNPDFQF